MPFFKSYNNDSLVITKSNEAQKISIKDESISLTDTYSVTGIASFGAMAIDTKRRHFLIGYYVSSSGVRYSAYSLKDGSLIYNSEFYTSGDKIFDIVYNEESDTIFMVAGTSTNLAFFSNFHPETGILGSTKPTSAFNNAYPSSSTSPCKMFTYREDTAFARISSTFGTSFDLYIFYSNLFNSDIGGSTNIPQTYFFDASVNASPSGAIININSIVLIEKYLYIAVEAVTSGIYRYDFNTQTRIFQSFSEVIQDMATDGEYVYAISNNSPNSNISKIDQDLNIVFSNGIANIGRSIKVDDNYVYALSADTINGNYTVLIYNNYLSQIDAYTGAGEGIELALTPKEKKNGHNFLTDLNVLYNNNKRPYRYPPVLQYTGNNFPLSTDGYTKYLYNIIKDEYVPSNSFYASSFEFSYAAIEFDQYGNIYTYNHDATNGPTFQKRSPSGSLIDTIAINSGILSQIDLMGITINGYAILVSDLPGTPGLINIHVIDIKGDTMSIADNFNVSNLSYSVYGFHCGMRNLYLNDNNNLASIRVNEDTGTASYSINGLTFTLGSGIHDYSMAEDAYENLYIHPAASNSIRIATRRSTYSSYVQKTFISSISGNNHSYGMLIDRHGYIYLFLGNDSNVFTMYKIHPYFDQSLTISEGYGSKFDSSIATYKCNLFQDDYYIYIGWGGDNLTIIDKKDLRFLRTITAFNSTSGQTIHMPTRNRLEQLIRREYLFR